MLVILRIMPQCLIRCVWLDENLICDERAKNFKKFIFIFMFDVWGGGIFLKYLICIHTCIPNFFSVWEH